MFKKSDQAGRYSKKNKKKALIHIPESANQKFANEYLAIKKIENIRISDGVWKAIVFREPVLAKLLSEGECNNGLGGISDNTCFREISANYSLCLHLENKCTGGKLQGKKQKAKAKILPYKLSDIPETTMELVDNFIKDADDLKNYLKNK